MLFVRQAPVSNVESVGTSDSVSVFHVVVGATCLLCTPVRLFLSS